MLEYHYGYSYVDALKTWFIWRGSCESIVSVAKTTSTVVISYSEGNRAKRYFEDVDLEYIMKLFESEGFSLVETTKNCDSLDRDSLTWVTVVFNNDWHTSSQKINYFLILWDKIDKQGI